MNRKTGIGIAVLVIVVAVVAFFMYRTPDRMVRNAFMQFQKETMHDFDATLSMDNKETSVAALQNFSRIGLNLKGTYQETNSSMATIASSFNLKAEGEGLSIEVAGQARLVDDRLYFYIEKVPNVPPGIEQLKGRWFSIPRGQASGDTPQVRLELTDLTYTGREKVNDDTTYKYSGHMSKDMVIDVVRSVIYVLGSNLTNQHVDQLQAAIQDDHGIPATFWLTPLTGTLRRFDTTIAADKGNALDISVVFTTPQETVAITAPEGAIPLDQLSAPAPATPTPAPKP